MTTSPHTFTDDRSIDSLPIASIRDPVSGHYAAYYVDMPWLVVQVKDKEQIREKLRGLMMAYLNDICKR